MPESLILKWTARFDEVPGAARALSARLKRQRDFARGQELISEGQIAGQHSLLLDGFAARYRLLGNGRRQITAIHLPGDFIDLHNFLLSRTGQGVVGLSSARVATIDRDGFSELADEHPDLVRLLWADSLIDAEIAREWLAAMGRRTASAHLAHFMCEIFVRLHVIGRTNDLSFHLPLTQFDLADILGLSSVHVNRVLKSLRKENMLVFGDQTVAILDWRRLVDFAEFELAYLGFRSGSLPDPTAATAPG